MKNYISILFMLVLLSGLSMNAMNAMEKGSPEFPKGSTPKQPIAVEEFSADLEEEFDDALLKAKARRPSSAAGRPVSAFGFNKSSAASAPAPVEELGLPGAVGFVSAAAPFVGSQFPSSLVLCEEGESHVYSSRPCGHSRSKTLVGEAFFDGASSATGFRLPAVPGLELSPRTLVGGQQASRLRLPTIRSTRPALDVVAELSEVDGDDSAGSALASAVGLQSAVSPDALTLLAAEFKSPRLPKVVSQHGKGPEDK